MSLKAKDSENPHKIVSLDEIRQIFSELPDVEEGLSYGTRAWRVKKKLIARIHQKEDALVVKTTFDHRESLMNENPLTYYITDHYANYPFILVRIPTVKRSELREVLGRAWQKAVGNA